MKWSLLRKVIDNIYMSKEILFDFTFLLLDLKVWIMD